MRICLLSKEYPPKTGWGGIGTFTYHLAHGLKQIGQDVEVVSLAEKGADAQATVSEDEEGILVHRASWRMGLDKLGLINQTMPYLHYALKTDLALWNAFLIRHRQEPFDVVDTPELLAEGFFPAITKLVPHVIRLYTPHSKFISDSLNNISNAIEHQAIAGLERAAMISADLLTSPSQDLADYVAADLGIDAGSIAIVGNPLDTDQVSPTGPNNRPDASFTVLFVGRIEDRKGIDYLAEAIPLVLSEAPQTRFIILGDDTSTGIGGTSKLREVKQTLAASGSSANIQFHPRVPLSQLPAHYRSCDVFVAPSLYDNSPYTCLEAMACARPVVGTSSGGTREYVLDEECGIIVPPRDAQSLAKAILRLAQDESLRKRFGENARRRAVEHYNRAVIAEKTVQLYRTAEAAFAENRAHAQYRRDAESVTADVSEFVLSYHKLLYDLLYAHSLPFKLRHWAQLISRRPRLMAAKTGLKLAQIVFKLLRVDSKRLAKLENMLAQKDQERELILLRELKG